MVLGFWDHGSSLAVKGLGLGVLEVGGFGRHGGLGIQHLGRFSTGVTTVVAAV